MECKIVAILVVLGVALVANSDAQICRYFCRYVCQLDSRGFHCIFRCVRFCGKKRRDTSEENELEFFLPREPCGMDTNKDGSIDLNELAKFLKLTTVEVEEAFNVIDTDSNSLISKEEWQNAPMDFIDGDACDDGSVV